MHALKQFYVRARAHNLSIEPFGEPRPGALTVTLAVELWKKEGVKTIAVYPHEVQKHADAVGLEFEAPGQTPTHAFIASRVEWSELPGYVHDAAKTANPAALQAALARWLEEKEEKT